eukprot:424452-Hanusia_phi.AAC.2
MISQPGPGPGVSRSCDVVRLTVSRRSGSRPRRDSGPGDPARRGLRAPALPSETCRAERIHRAAPALHS